MGRVLAIDYGDRRIGLAVSDPTRTVAQPLATLKKRSGKRAPMSRLIEIADEHDVDTIVVGLPLEESGREGPQAARTREFGEALRRRTGRAIEYRDERFTSARARREIGRLDLPAAARREKERVDAMAAVFILQSYLDERAP